METTTHKKAPRIFISYSWSNQEHKDKVIDLAARLRNHGVDVVLDVFDLHPGQDKYTFMEQTVIAEDISKVLLVCDKFYCEKANERKGGVGEETMIISPELYGKANQEKFIPVVFEFDENGDPYLPAYIKSRIFVSLSDENYEDGYEELLRNIHGKPEISKPPLGKIPEWLEEEKINFFPVRTLMKQIEKSADNPKKVSILSRKFKDEFIKAAKSFTVTDKKIDGKIVVETIEKMKPLRDLFIDFMEALLTTNLSMADELSSILESVRNICCEKSFSSYLETDLEYFNFFIWELLLCSVAFLYHYELFDEVKKMLNKTYFICLYHGEVKKYPKTFVEFRKHFAWIEEDYKPFSKEPNLYSYAANILVKRENSPVITQESLSFADILLSQLSYLYAPEESFPWFPASYIYNSGASDEWGKFVSLSYCEKVMGLYGANSIEELKKIISEIPDNSDVKYPSCSKRCPSIISSIRLERIGSMG